MKAEEPKSETRAGPGLAGAIKQLFRDVKKALTGRDDEPAPAVKRRRREKTGRAFRIVAKKIMRRLVRLPPQAYARAPDLMGAVDWLNLWHHQDDFTDDIQAAPIDHLYPHP